MPLSTAGKRQVYTCRFPTIFRNMTHHRESPTHGGKSRPSADSNGHAAEKKFLPRLHLDLSPMDKVDKDLDITGSLFDGPVSPHPLGNKSVEVPQGQDLHPHIAIHGLKQVPNFRDCGTLSHCIAFGRLYRGGTPANATPEDNEYLIDTLGIRTIIDLRSKEESSGDIGDNIIHHRFSDFDAEMKLFKKVEKTTRPDLLDEDVFQINRGQSFRMRSATKSGTSLDSHSQFHSFSTQARAHKSVRKKRGSNFHDELEKAMHHEMLHGDFESQQHNEVDAPNVIIDSGADWESISDADTLRAEIYRLQQVAKSLQRRGTAHSFNGGPVGRMQFAPSSIRSLSGGTAPLSSLDRNGNLIMLRPSSGKWRETWCVLSGDEIQFCGTEKERIVNLTASSSLCDQLKAEKGHGKWFVSGKIKLDPDVVCVNVEEGSTVLPSALFPTVQARAPVPANAFMIEGSGGHAYYFAYPESEEVSKGWFNAIHAKIERTSDPQGLLSPLTPYEDSREHGRCLYRCPYADRKTMTKVLMGLASKATILQVAGFFVAGAKDKAKGKMIQLFDKQGLLGLNKIILEHNSDRLLKALKIVAERKNHPVLIHCSHGKDRTGLTIAIIMRALGATPEDIANDYHISEAHGRTPEAIAIFQKHSPLLTLDVWTRAPVQVMLDTLSYIDTKYGSIEAYLTHIGFNAVWQARLKTALKVSSKTVML